jgi:signal transduction histidine kinase
MNIKNIFNGLNLRTKFVVSISALLITTIFSFSTYLSKQQADGYRNELESTSETMIRMLSINVEYGVLFESKSDIEDALKILSQFEYVKYAVVRNNSDKILATIGDEIGVFKRIRRIDEKEENHDKFCEDYYVVDLKGEEYIELNYPVLSNHKDLDREILGITAGFGDHMEISSTTEQIGKVKVIISLEAVNAAIADAQKTAILLSIIISILTMIILTFFIRIITKPIRLMVKATDKISLGELDHRVPIEQQDEIGQLAETFNRMVETLKESRDEVESYNKMLEGTIQVRTKELEATQAQLVQSEKLSAIGQLAAGVAHELNNPLGGILGYAQFTLEKLKKNNPGKLTKKEYENYIRYISDIEKQASRCKGIVQNLLRFSRSTKNVEFEEVDLNILLAETCTFIEHQLSMKQIELKLNLDSNLPNVQGNPGQLQQVFTNIILNAMQASPPNTAIEVATRFSPPLGQFNGTVELLFSDQGHGICEADVNKIFEPFFTTKEVGKGTGLGLSVSYGIIKEHGGEIKVESEVNKGTTFAIIIPLQNNDTISDKTNKQYAEQI